MAKRSRKRLLGELETLVMRVVWRDGEVTVPDVHAALSEVHKLAYTTVLTTMRNLEKKGFLARKSAGRGHAYRARVDERTAAGSAVKDLLERWFNGSEVQFANALFEGERLRPEEFEKLRQEILELRRQEEE